MAGPTRDSFEPAPYIQLERGLRRLEAGYLVVMGPPAAMRTCAFAVLQVRRV